MESLFHMNVTNSVFRGKRVGVIGFNARPIAQSLKRAGAKTYVSDYWGDLDLKEVSDSCIAVLSPTTGIRQRQPLNMPMQKALMNNFFELTKGVEIDHVVIGSGFDDFSGVLLPLEERDILLGCGIDEMKNARKRRSLERVINSLDVQLPRQVMIKSIHDVDIESLTFPCLVRKPTSGGGRGIKLVRNSEELMHMITIHSGNKKAHRTVIQQYIKGKDISCSVLGTGKESKALSVQSQLIGTPTAGRNCDFVYCGNYIPTAINRKCEQRIVDISERICSQLHLRGSIGIDYVLDPSGQIWLMEVNPRIQGTLEMLEIAGDISVTNFHFQAMQGTLPLKVLKFRPTLKLIIYSRKMGEVPNLTRFPNVVDRTPPGVIVSRGDPICTVIESGTDISECYSRASNIAIQIQREVRARLKTTIANK